MKKKKNNHIGEGEHTGHFHLASGKDVAVYEDEQDMQLDTPDGCTVSHQEHKQIEIPAGRYHVGGVLEYDPALEEARRVKD